jgi:protein-S-isoprenylcysteine O-methyltransferase Ste14
VTRLDGRLGGPLPAWGRLAGAALALAGGALGLWCIALFVTAGHGTPAPFDAPRRFVAAGPYRWVRNPMYLGGVSFLGGVGLWLRSPAMALLAVAALGVAHVFVRTYEEPVLARAFGATYDEYRRQVHRWIPRRPADPSGRAPPPAP